MSVQNIDTHAVAKELKTDMKELKADAKTIQDDANLPDPIRLLMLVAIDTQEKEIGIQAGFSSLLQGQSEGATQSMAICQAILTAQGNKMSADTTSSAMQTDNALYNTMQTMISDVNNKYSNIMQAGGTTVTDLTQVEQQSLQLCQVSVDFLNNLTQLISAWSS